MSWQVAWPPAAIQSLTYIHWRDASRVAAAVEHYAATGEGELFRIAGDDAVTWRLRVGPHRVRLSLDRRERVLWVWYVYRL